jgi:dihydroxy-acid dehydratase
VTPALRSARWFEPDDLSGFMHRAALRGAGFTPRAGQPVIGICNAWSELVHCNMHFRALANAVKRGIADAGGLALEFPTMSLGETLMKPTTMLFRNLMAMDVEESIRANPLDGVVLIGGCDKTIPAQLLGAASADVPAICVTGGTSLPAVFGGRHIGIGDVWKAAAEFRAGRMTGAEFAQLEAAAIPSSGHCPEMGTASTMAALVEALGMALPGSSTETAHAAQRYATAELAGRRAVELALGDTRPSHILTPAAFENAITLLVGVGGSTNAVIHLLALAGRLGVDLDLDRFHQVARRTPLVANVQPAGEHLVARLHEAGGIPAVLSELEPLLDITALTVTGEPLGRSLSAPREPDRQVIATLDRPFKPAGGLAVVRGTLAPDGAVVKVTAASSHLLRHRGPALVFEGPDDLAGRIDDPDLPVTPETVMILRNVGPRGGPGMPEWGMLPIPRKLLREGVTDMLRISDARMSGTAFGTTVLHTAPEAAVGGPLALVEDGDFVEIDVEAQRLDLLVSPEELADRRAAWRPPPPKYERGYGALFLDHALQAPEGCDFDFLRARATRDREEPHGILEGWIGGW